MSIPLVMIVSAMIIVLIPVATAEAPRETCQWLTGPLIPGNLPWYTKTTNFSTVACPLGWTGVTGSCLHNSGTPYIEEQQPGWWSEMSPGICGYSCPYGMVPVEGVPFAILCCPPTILPFSGTCGIPMYKK